MTPSNYCVRRGDLGLKEAKSIVDAYAAKNSHLMVRQPTSGALPSLEAMHKVC